MKTLIAVPCMDQVAAPFAQSLATMQKTGETFVSFIIGSLIYDSRNNLAKQALKMECDAIMWLDSDMIFPADTLPRMIKHLEEGKDIVTGIYYRRRTPFTPVLFKTLEIDGDNSTFESLHDYPKDRPFEIAGCGFGCCITRTDVFWDIGMEEGSQWFTPITGFGEDLSFCYRARQHGRKIWADPSIQCGHVGQIIIDQNVYEASIN